jgi:CDP-paratose 2-epimerase
MKKILVTGSSGLVGSECVRFFDGLGWQVHGIDNNMRMSFFGQDGDTRPVRSQLEASTRNFVAHDFDIRQRDRVEDLYRQVRPDVTVHCAAQPSHDLARERTLDDFEINAMATLGLLQAAWRHGPESVFVFMSTNKVYGDAPNDLPLKELKTRWDYADPAAYEGIDETCRIDASTHSFFGVSKAAADLLVQEFGRCYGMKTACFRGGCLTGPQHASAELHGFLAYLVKAAKEGREYTIYGYQGKQVRDNLHTHDVCAAFWSFIQQPRTAAVYNLGGGRANSLSVLEAVAAVEARLGVTMKIRYRDEARLGDHICYISDLRRWRSDYPDWQIRYPLDDLLDSLCR